MSSTRACARLREFCWALLWGFLPFLSLDKPGWGKQPSWNPFSLVFDTHSTPHPWVLFPTFSPLPPPTHIFDSGCGTKVMSVKLNIGRNLLIPFIWADRDRKHREFFLACLFLQCSGVQYAQSAICLTLCVIQQCMRYLCACVLSSRLCPCYSPHPTLSPPHTFLEPH